MREIMDFELAANETNLDSLKGARESFKKLTFQYLEQIWQTAALLDENESRVIQLVQDTFINTFRRWNRAGCQENCRILLFRTLAELLFPKNKWHDLQTEVTCGHSHIDHQSIKPKSISCHTLSQALARLRTDIRFVTVLSLRQRFAYGEIAEIIGSEIETVQAIVYAGRRQLHLEMIKMLSKSAKPGPEKINTFI
jgi:DNA-directed RNA polymerase specialized sigma24 family protein